VQVGGEARGIFTYCLLDALKGSGNQISYSELIGRVRLRIRNKVSDPQTAQLQASHTEDKAYFFLSASSAPEAQPYLLAYDKHKKSWLLNAGALHGILPDTNLSMATLPSPDDKHRQVVSEVFPTYALVNKVNGLDKAKSYKVKIIKTIPPALSVAFAECNDPLGETLLQNKFAEENLNSIHVVKKPKESNFLIHAKADHYFLTHLDEVVINPKTGIAFPLKNIRSVFKKIKNYNDDAATLFIHYLHKVMKWHQYLELGHPQTSIREKELQISLSLSGLPNETFKPTDWRHPETLTYTEQNGRWHKPKFRLKIKNTGRRKLWVSLLYFDSLYGIDNILIPKDHSGVPEAYCGYG